jgi:heptosyltransferase-2
MNSAVKSVIKAGMYGSFRVLALFSGKDRPRDPRRILLVAGGYLGDTFWALQTVPTLKTAFPEAEIHLAGRPFLHVLANGLVPDERIHEVAVVSDRTRESCSFGKLKRDAAVLREAVRPDLVIDLMCNRYSAWFCHHLGSYVVGMDIAEEASPLYSFCAKRDLIPSVHLAYRQRSIVKQFLGQVDSPELELVPPVPQKTRAEIFSELSLESSDRIVMLIPGAGWPAKRWAPERYHELARRLAEQGFRVIVSGAPDEKELCAGIADGIAGGRALCGALSDTVSLLPHCHAVAGNDSGVVHLAAAFGVKTVTMFCQTNPAFCGPLGKRSLILRAACPYAPEEGEHFCRGGVRLTCERPERMNCSVEQVLDLICRP